MAAHRLIIDPPAPGMWNMAVDEALLMDAAEQGVATLRLYQWNEPTLSLGYFQQYDDRRQHEASRECACVRRQTGGGAILHDRELTYSLALPVSHPLARQSERLYKSVHEAFIAVLTPMLGGEDSKWILRRRDQESDLPAREEPFLCFLRRSSGDVVLMSPNPASDAPRAVDKSPPDWKILGSAQRRHRGAILQHGSLLLHTSRAAPELAGLGNLTGLDLIPEELWKAVIGPMTSVLELRLLPSGLPPDLELKAHQLANNKYGAAVWTKRH